ncbi:hypothetical protein JMB76_004977 [Salmonella enterica]|nr:hypothetical protein [Salmonella enterica]EHA6668772.1 hypothetical protein [Salmonella enterica]
MFMPPVFPAHWHVSQPVLIADTFSSLVWKVSLPDGTPAIVKGLKPIFPQLGTRMEKRSNAI